MYKLYDLENLGKAMYITTLGKEFDPSKAPQMTELAIYQMIAGSKCCISIRQLAEIFSMDIKAVHKVVKRLEEKGYIEMISKGTTRVKGATYKLLKEKQVNFTFSWSFFEELDLKGAEKAKVIGYYIWMRSSKNNYGKSICTLKKNEVNKKYMNLLMASKYIEWDYQPGSDNEKVVIKFVKERKYNKRE